MQQKARRWSLALLIVVAVASIGGVVMLLADGGSDAETEVIRTETEGITTDTVPFVIVTSGPAQTSTTEAQTSTTEGSADRARQESIEGFTVAFNAALDRGDDQYLFDRLHPAVIAEYGPDTCREYVKNTVTMMRTYRLTGPVGEPAPAEFVTLTGTIDVDALYLAPASFRFQGQSVENTGAFAYIDDEVRWFTNCE